MKPEPLLPAFGEDAAPFFDGCRAGELRIQRCRDTGRLIFPPRPVSPWGSHAEPEWTVVSGRGTIWSFALPHPPLLPWFAKRAPYNVVLVALEEDPRIRLVGNLLAREGGELGDVPEADLAIGTPVRVVFDPVSPDVTLPRWVAVRKET